MKFCLPLLTAVSLALAPIGAVAADETQALSPDTVLATVDGTEITLGHMLAVRSSLPPHYDQLDPTTLFDGILEQLVQQALLSQSLEGEPALQTRLTIENETRAIRAGAAIDAVMREEFTEDEIQAAYKSEYVDRGPDIEYRAAHILVETEEKAQSLIKALADGADFAALAQEHSTGPSGPNGGELGWFGKGVMVEPFFDAVTRLDVGGVSEPVQTQFGFHVITLLDTRSQDVPSLDDVREQLVNELRNEKFQNHVATLKSKAMIDQIEAGTIDPSVVNQTDLLEQ
ncbi:peptidylprolyl isomerase [Roseovarius faecimaris]|uniref:Parvulin-like PPIase n=1 Tax=Roseovarius faecimaris TaxID=2494550 RepID=A0A6I6J5Q3_9RHOB|nr:peptidylprolyl isomerase [Roseovarius faecimaris]QGY00099.1 peptidylprolyl isomerase [Roseovarius faecimaris]